VPGEEHTFRVDLHGLVDLLANHLYSSPRVYVRELLQNAADAVAARRLADPAAPAGRITVAASGHELVIRDNGIGLTEQDIHTFLATIGRSSKRDQLGELDITSARRDFIGQFGIGLLACFMVAGEITLETRCARPGSVPVRWHGRPDGQYEVQQLGDEHMPEPGTRVILTARAGAEDWLSPAKVTELARHFGDLLPVPVEVVTGDGVTTTVSTAPAVWEREYASAGLRRAALLSYGERTLGFAPLDVIELTIPVAGLRGAAYVLPDQVSPAQRGRHRVYLKGMLLTEDGGGLLPDWAFFVRCVINADGLRPTASREDLYQDETLSAVRDGLGAQIRNWIADLAASRPADLRTFLLTHNLAVKALARFDTGLLRTMLPWLPFETTDGEVSLDEFTRTHRTILVSRTVDEFHQVAAIASAAGLAVVNGGYTYDADLVRRLPEIRPEVTVLDLEPATVLAHLDSAEPEAELAAAMFLGAARQVLDPMGCDVVLRTFTPASVPALLLDDRDARHERARAAAQAEASGVWGEILGALRGTAPRAQLVLNQLSPLVRRVADVGSADLATVAIEALYGHALLMSRRPLRAAETALLNRSFLGLLDQAVRNPAAEDNA
jgi:molecular chaperone HtpG